MANEKAPGKEATTLRMPVELKQRLQSEADKKGMSLNELVLLIFDDYIQLNPPRG